MGARLRLLLVAAGVGTAAVVVASSVSHSPGDIRDRVDDLGVLGPIAFLVITPLLAAAFFPGPFIAAASGLLFGTLLGTPVAIVGATLSALLALAISRRAGRGAYDELVGPHVRRWQELIEERGFAAVLLARTIPVGSFTVTNYAAGLTRLRPSVFAAATVIGIAPRTYAYVALGGNLDDLGRPEAVVAIALIVLTALFGLGLLWRERRRATSARRPSGPGTGSSSPDDRSAAPP
jgi:uncharacterized membrane protein YdjX (TVP38/TMEM64 family)